MSADSSCAASASADDIRRGFVYRFVSVSACRCWRSPWQREYMVMKDGSLFFYENSDSLVPKLHSTLYGAACIFPQFPKTNKPNTLEVSAPNSSIMFYVEDASEVKQWATAIQRNAVIASGGKLSK